MKTILRMLLAAFLAPFVVIPAVFVTTVAVHLVDIIQFDFLSPDQLDDMVGFFKDAVVLAVFGVYFGWALAIVFGFPAYGLLRLGGLAQPVPAALVGAAFGALFGAEFADYVHPAYLVIMTTCGALVAATFCRIVNGKTESV